jgi:hypothetical protein
MQCDNCLAPLLSLMQAAAAALTSARMCGISQRPKQLHGWVACMDAQVVVHSRLERSWKLREGRPQLLVQLITLPHTPDLQQQAGRQHVAGACMAPGPQVAAGTVVAGSS